MYSIDGETFNNVFIPLDEVWLIDQYIGLNSLWIWGDNTYGQLGDNSITNKSSPIQTVAGGNVWKIADVAQHTAAIKTDGTLWMWGRNAEGQVGDNTVASKSSPVQTTAGGTNWTAVACGINHTIALKQDGTLWAWGNNGSGQLGDNTIVHKSSPVQTGAGGTSWKQISGAGMSNNAAIKTDGTLWTWGDNTYGQLGDNSITNKSSPIQTVAGGTNWVSLSVGQCVAGIKTDGTLWTWGYNQWGQLGDNTIVHKSSPVQTVAGGTDWKQVNCGLLGHTAAIKTDGSMWSWGYNAYGQLGDNTVTNKSSPVQTITGGTNWKKVACGYYHTAALKTDGTLWTWGYGPLGGLGDNTLVHKSSPVQTIAGGTSWKHVEAGYYTTLTIK